MKSTFSHSLDIPQVLEKLGSSGKGLSHDEAKTRLNQFGPNSLKGDKKRRGVLLFLNQFHSFFIYLLFAAVVISFALDNEVDGYLILAIILINATIGFVQEYRAEKSIESLKSMIVAHANVFRDGVLQKIDSRLLVPGDVISLEEGEQIPADARIIEASNIRTMESSLTGESLPVSKDIFKVPLAASVADRKNMLWKGTFVAGGKGLAVVTETGTSTQIGQVATSLRDIDEKPGLLNKRVDRLALQLGIFATIGAALTFVVGYFVRGFEFTEVFLFTIASLVAAIPEGLPAVIAIVLSIGAHRMARNNAIVRKLSATETLGHATIIATDKTGTLTQNTMTVERIVLSDNTRVDVSGNGWDTEGEFTLGNKKAIPGEYELLDDLLTISAVCNNADVTKVAETGEYKVLGDPTEVALVVLAKKGNKTKEEILKNALTYKDFAFNKDLRFRGALLETSKTKRFYLFGAPESLLSKCSEVPGKDGHNVLTIDERRKIEKNITDLSKQGLRVLAFAYASEFPENITKLEDVELQNLKWVGLVGMKDPARQEVESSIALAKSAGIRVMMKTGDHKETAIAIAKEVGILDGKKSNGFPLAVTGPELEAMSETQFKETIENVSVFARLTPRLKLRIISHLQDHGEIVAMTGDGVNDAPALKKADIGVSMGITGTDVARASSEMVLSDDNFSTIVRAVKEGRIVFRNIRQVTYFLLTTNFAESITILTALLIGFALPLLPVQVLWLNLITDGLVVLALAAEPDHFEILLEKPTKRNIGILSKEVVPFFIIMVIGMTITTLWVFQLYEVESLEKARTGAFTVLAISQLFNVLNMRSLKYSVFKIGLFSNKYIWYAIFMSFIPLPILFYVPFLSEIFSFVPLSLQEFLFLTLVSSLILWLGEGFKLMKSRLNNDPGS